MARLNLCSVIFLVVFIFIIFPSSAPPSSADEARYRTAISLEKEYLAILNSSSYGDFAPNNEESGASSWLNLTGLRETDEYAWNLLLEAQQQAREQLQYAAGSAGLALLDGSLQSTPLFYRNVTGFVNGRWVAPARAKERPRPMLNLTLIAPDADYDSSVSFSRNLTSTEGKLQTRFTEKDLPQSESEQGKVHAVSAKFTIEDESVYGDGWEIGLHGVHFRESGSIILTTTSEK